MSVSRIDSRHNPRFKQWKKYALHPERPECPWVAVEGWKAAADAAALHTPQLLLHSAADDHRLPALAAKSEQTVRLPERLLGELSTVETPQGVLAFFQKPDWSWSQLPDRILCPRGLQDPGNLGTLMRTAQATGFGVAAGPGTVSVFNPKAVRASAAALFAVPFVENAQLEEIRRRGYRLAAADSSGREPLFEADLHPPVAILVGNEGSGLDPATLEQADLRVRIPMLPGSESLNAAVAGSLLLFEVCRRWPPAAFST